MNLILPSFDIVFNLTIISGMTFVMLMLFGVVPVMAYHDSAVETPAEVPENITQNIPSSSLNIGEGIDDVVSTLMTVQKGVGIAGQINDFIKSIRFAVEDWIFFVQTTLADPVIGE